MNIKKCYVVINHGGQREDSLENVVCVFMDKTKAEEFVKQNTDLELTISQKMNDDSENSLPWTELIQKYFPEEAQTREGYDWYGYMIEERDLCL